MHLRLTCLSWCWWMDCRNDCLDIWTPSSTSSPIITPSSTSSTNQNTYTQPSWSDLVGSSYTIRDNVILMHMCRTTWGGCGDLCTDEMQRRFRIFVVCILLLLYVHKWLRNAIACNDNLGWRRYVNANSNVAKHPGGPHSGIPQKPQA